jgi:peptide/nickel transport system ATP-binding protein
MPNESAMTQPLLNVKGLQTHFATREGLVRAVDGVDLHIDRGRTLCVVGESGSGKSMAARSILQIVASPGKIVSGSIVLAREGRPVVDIAKLNHKGREIRAIRGRDIAMIFQEPMNSMSPVLSIGNQLIEKIVLHHKLDKKAATERAAEALARVEIPDPRRCLRLYPFELSGGMRQRVMIAMALACQPALLIADEPTTALDVTTQANILALLARLQAEFGMAVMFITHNLGVVAQIADDVAVMYLGRIVERAGVDAIFDNPQHPYTQALLRSIPKLGARKSVGERLNAIAGMVPHPLNRPPGCPFNTRCAEAVPGLCDTTDPLVHDVASDHVVACHMRPARRVAA